MRHTRLPLLSLVVFLVGLAGQQVALAAPRAFAHERVRQDLREQGQAKVIVTFADEKLPQARAADWRQRVPAISSLRARVMQDAPKFQVRREFVTQALLAGTVNDESLAQLQRSSVVTGIYPDRKFKIALKESGPLIGQPEAQAAEFAGAGIAIAIIDSGIDYKHPDFGGNSGSTFPTAKIVGGWDFVNNDNDLTKPLADGPMDDNGHGTHIAGAAAGIDSTYRGIAPSATLVAYKAVDKNGFADSGAILAALDRVIQDRTTYNIKVVNLSLSDQIPWTSSAEFASYYPDEAAVYQDVASHGIVIVAAAGNEGYLDGIGSPAVLDTVIGVGATYDATFATTQNWGDCQDPSPPVDTPVCFSNRGELIDLYAPGAFITSAKASQSTDPSRPGDPVGFITEAGTSSASPHVAGAAACVISMLYPDPTASVDPALVRQRLKLTGAQVYDPATHVATPRVDLVGAMNPPTTGPDLVVTSVSTTASSAFVGESIPLSITVANQGDVAAPSCSAIIVLSVNDTISPGDYVAATVSVPAIAAGGVYSTTTVTGAVPSMPSGMFTVGGFADSGYIVTERDETNNGKAGNQLPIGSSATVASNDIPEFMTKGHSYTISASMRNEGAAPWTTAEGYELTAVSPVSTTRWGTVHVPLPGGAAVNPLQTVTFTFNVTAPVTATWVPCHWQMSKNGHVFGEVATGASEVQVTNDLSFGQDFPAVSGDRVAYEDYRGDGSVSVTDLRTMGMTRLPQDIPFPLDGLGIPLPPFDWTTADPSIGWYPYQWYPSVSGPWVSWMIDDAPDPASVAGPYFQVLSYNLDTYGVLPVRVDYNPAHPSDQWYPCVDGHLMVYEDYRSDPNRMPGGITTDNSDIYIADLSAPRDANSAVPTYPLTIAPGPQYDPRISGDIVVWEDWRYGAHADIFMYDLSVDSNGNGIPNWKEPPGSRPMPDPAEIRLTNTAYSEMYPDVDGRTVVWMDLRRASAGLFLPTVDIYALDLETMTVTPVATDPGTFRAQPRIDARKVVWSDYRHAQPDVFWKDLDTDILLPLVVSSADEDLADISGNRVVFDRQVSTDSWGFPVYNIFARQLFTNASVGIHTFTDVNNDYWAWQWIEAVAASGVTRGYPDGSYAPGTVVARDQMAVYTARALAGADSNVTAPASVDFPDVPADHWAYRYIEYCYTHHIVQGFSDGSYQPALPVTRGQMAVFIARAVAGSDAAVPTGPATATFSDVATTYWAFAYIEYCADPARGIVRGFPNGTYRPEEAVTRDQMAVYIARAFHYVTE